MEALHLFENEHRNAKPIRTANDWMSATFPQVSQVHPFAFIQQSNSEDSFVVEVLDLDDSCFSSLLGPLGNPAFPAVHHQGQFLRYNPDKGIYEPLHVERMMAEWSFIIDRCASFFGDRANVQSFQALKHERILCRVVKRARELLQVDDDFFQDNDSRFLALQNGILDIRSKELLPFSPAYRFKFSLPVKFDPQAKPTNFLAFFRSVLDEDDLDLLQEYLGSCLLERNYPQKLLIMSGESGAGKGVILRLLEDILGSERVGILRDQFFTDRFELARFEGRKVLIHPDMPSEFLNTSKASMVKQLVGGDSMWVDKKGKENPIELKGQFHAILCCNESPQIKMEKGELKAWKRRLAVIEFKEPRNRMGKLSEILGAVEKSAVFNLLLQGREKVIKNGYQIHLTKFQEDRVMKLLANANAHQVFVQECLEMDRNGELLVEDVRIAFQEYCREKNLGLSNGYGATKWITEGIKREFGARMRHDLTCGGGKARKGWKGLKLKRTDNELEGEGCPAMSKTAIENAL